MKASELRIGNLIDTINREGKVHLPHNTAMKVFEINAFDVIIYDPDKHPATLRTMSCIGSEDICGIPLTEEWLAKFGFYGEWPFISIYLSNKNHLTLSRFTDDEYKKVEVKITWDYTGRIIGYIYYVHQLQNLYFALTEKELEIKP